MHNRLRKVSILIAVLVLAVALTAAMSGGVMARTTFQSSIQLPTDTPVPVAPILPPPATPGPAEFTPQPAPPVEVGGQAPGVPGFLPPPTLTNPNALVPGQSLPLRPSGQSPLVGPTVRPPEPTPEALAPAGVPSPAQLIDNGIVALSYLWLCCGAVGLAGAALTLVWLARRSTRR